MDYSSAWHPVGTYFFTVNCVKRNSNDTVKHIEDLKGAIAKVGMVDGKVLQVRSADATDKSATVIKTVLNKIHPLSSHNLPIALLPKLNKQSLEIENDKLHLTSGVQVVAEIKQADQTVMEYLLFPVLKAFHEAGRER